MIIIKIKTLHFEDYEYFAYAVSDVYDRVKSDDAYNSVDVVAKYENAKEIIRELLESDMVLHLLISLAILNGMDMMTLSLSAY